MATTVHAVRVLVCLTLTNMTGARRAENSLWGRFSSPAWCHLLSCPLSSTPICALTPVFAGTIQHAWRFWVRAYSTWRCCNDSLTHATQIGTHWQLTVALVQWRRLTSAQLALKLAMSSGEEGWAKRKLRAAWSTLWWTANDAQVSSRIVSEGWEQVELKARKEAWWRWQATCIPWHLVAAAEERAAVASGWRRRNLLKAGIQAFMELRNNSKKKALAVAGYHVQMRRRAMRKARHVTKVWIGANKVMDAAEDFWMWGFIYTWLSYAALRRVRATALGQAEEAAVLQRQAEEDNAQQRQAALLRLQRLCSEVRAVEWRQATEKVRKVIGDPSTSTGWAEFRNAAGWVKHEQDHASDIVIDSEDSTDVSTTGGETGTLGKIAGGAGPVEELRVARLSQELDQLRMAAVEAEAVQQAMEAAQIREEARAEEQRGLVMYEKSQRMEAEVR